MNEVTTRPSSLPATEAENPFEAYGRQASMRTFVGELLKFSKGDYLAGMNNEDIPVNSKMIANMDTLVVGWVKWEDNKPVDMIMGLVAERFQPPKRKELGDLDEKEWEVDEQSGKPRDPWQFSNNIVLVNPDDLDEVFTFTTASRGGLQAIGEMSKMYGKEMRSRPNDYPIITLGVDKYKHSNPQFGWIKIPVFDIVGWVPKSTLAPAQSELDLGQERSDNKTDNVTHNSEATPRF